MTPTFLQYAGGFTGGPANTMVAALPVPATLGNLVVISCAGNPVGSISVSSPGFTTALQNSTFGQALMYKLAGPSEPANYTITVSGSGGTLAGGWIIQEHSGVSDKVIQTVRSTSGSSSTKSTPAIDAKFPCLGVSILAKGNSAVWDPTWAGVAGPYLGGVGEHKSSYKTFAVPPDVLGEVMTWTASNGVAVTNTIDLALFMAKPIYF